MKAKPPTQEAIMIKQRALARREGKTARALSIAIFDCLRNAGHTYYVTGKLSIPKDMDTCEDLLNRIGCKYARRTGCFFIQGCFGQRELHFITLKEESIKDQYVFHDHSVGGPIV